MTELVYAGPDDVVGEEEEEEEVESPRGGRRGGSLRGIRVTASLPESTPTSIYPPKAVHQCTVCNKIFVSFKGLQQHAVIHTDQKPFACDICGKAFRFKSNLFEHRSVHSGQTPHSCPYCGKTCRLKGNLKKHLKTHVNSKEELEEAWKPFASNRRPPQEVPEDAIIVRSTGEPYLTPVSRPRKKKLGLGNDAKLWVDKVKKGDLLPTSSIQEKLQRLGDLLRSAEENYFTAEECLEQARAIPLERFDCPLCKHVFMSRLEAAEHLELEHPSSRHDRPLFCEICLKSFSERKTFDQHVGYHNRIHHLVETNQLTLHDPLIQIVEEDDTDQICLKSFSERKTFDQHVGYHNRIHHLVETNQLTLHDPLIRGVSNKHDRPLFCEICLKSFSERKTFDQHVGYHNRIHRLVETNQLTLHDPLIQIVEEDDTDQICLKFFSERKTFDQHVGYHNRIHHLVETNQLTLHDPLIQIVEEDDTDQICLKSFSERKTFDQHVGYHNRIHHLVETNQLTLHDPLIQIVEEDGTDQICLKFFSERKTFDQHVGYHNRIHHLVETNQLTLHDPLIQIVEEDDTDQGYTEMRVMTPGKQSHQDILDPQQFVISQPGQEHEVEL